MKYRTISKKPKRELTVPELMGGINYRDSVSMVLDNQLTDSVNMWYKDGVLKTRPGAVTDDAMKLAKTYDVTSGTITNTSARIFEEIKYRDDEGNTYVLFSNKINYEYNNELGNGKINKTIITFGWQGKNRIIDLPSIYISSNDITYFVVIKKTTLYCFISNSEIHKLNVSDSDSDWTELSDDDFTAPLVAYDGVQIDGYNLLCNRYRIQEEIKEETSWMLPHKIPSGSTKVTARIIGIDGEDEIHTVNIDGSSTEYIEKTPINYWKLYVDTAPATDVDLVTTLVGIADQDGNKISGEHMFGDYVIEITADYDYDVSAGKKKISAMTRAEWFGGASIGINGGTRLFLGGNTNDNEKSLVVWSGLDDPLYFPENCYAYVGNSTQAVTAFGKQSDMLVMFKENETYFTQYTRNDSITADNLINQSVVDYAASNVYFPITQIHANIGCDCPDTVQLCRNRLVWTNSDGKVYTLVSNNQYSERNIFEVGEMIERRLKTEIDLKNATSCDWEGHYVLLCENRAYLMDYNSSGYQYAYSYQKNEDANIRIPWYYWEIVSYSQVSVIAEIGGSLIMLSNSYAGRNAGWRAFRIDGDAAADIEMSGESEMSELPIHSEMQTKLFDFGAAGYYKNVDLVNLSLGNNGGAPIMVDFVTDAGSDSDEIVLESEETESYTAGYVTSVPLHPCIRSVLRFGLKLSCEGMMAVDGMSLQYRILGGAR